MRAILVLTTIAASLGLSWGAGPAAPPPGERAVAFGLYLDAPRSSSVLDRAIVLADGLRARYGLASGDVDTDRQQAAQRAAVELGAIEVREAEVECAARALHTSIEGPRCERWCANARELARLELLRAALEEWGGLDPSNPRVARCRGRTGVRTGLR